MYIAYSPIYSYSLLPEGHRFPMEKYDLLPQQLLHDGTLTEADFFEPDCLAEEVILRTHTKVYWDKLQQGNLSRHEIRALGFPFHPTLVTRGRHISQGTIDAAIYSLEHGIGMNIAGGTHHAFADRGEGFCMFNDFAIASNQLLFTKQVGKILIVDLDVHQGNGTAKIFQDEPRVFTFSMHGEHNYPLRKEKSDLDIGLPDRIQDEEYLKILEKTLPQLIEQVKPDIIFYLSGVDVLETDKLGRLALTKMGAYRRDEFVFSLAKQKNIPITVSMGGGYSHKIADIVDAHANTFRLAKKMYE